MRWNRLEVIYRLQKQTPNTCRIHTFFSKGNCISGFFALRHTGLSSPNVITSAAHRKSVFASISLPPKFKLFCRKSEPGLVSVRPPSRRGMMKCSFTVVMPASAYLTPACRQEATDTSFRCVALFPAEPTFFFWPSQGKAALFNVAAFHLRSLPRSLRQTKHTPWFYCCQQLGQTEELL